MAPDEYTKALEKALSDLEERVLRRDLLMAEIAGLKETVRVLASRVKLSSEIREKVAQLIAQVDSATPSLTDAIRSLLTRIYPQEMSAVEVRNELEDSSDEANVSLSACHSALKRMLTEGEVELGSPKEGKATYRRVLPTLMNTFDNLNYIATLVSTSSPDYSEAAARLGERNTVLTPAEAKRRMRAHWEKMNKK